METTLNVYELHQNEQYFFAEDTVDQLEQFLGQYEYVCCICAPTLGKRFAEKGKKVKILDIDRRFENLKIFRYFDINKPDWLGERFDIIVCDPPFFNVSLSNLFAAVRTLSMNNFAQPLLASYLKRRAANILGTFSQFGLVETGYSPTYKTVKNCTKNDIEFFGNLGEANHLRLRQE